jgi:hypothetical protein
LEKEQKEMIEINKTMLKNERRKSGLNKATERELGNNRNFHCSMRPGFDSLHYQRKERQWFWNGVHSAS